MRQKCSRLTRAESFYQSPQPKDQPLNAASPPIDPRPALPTSAKAGYGVGQIAGQLFRDAPSLLLLFYLSSIMGVPPGIAGAAIFIPKVFFGAIFDLGIGTQSDRLDDRFPRRHWLLVGAIAAPFAMLGAFMVPETSEVVQMTWIFVAFSFYMAIFSTFSVPYLAQFAEMSDSPDERTEMMAWKHGFTGVGLLVGASGTPVLVHYLGGDRPAYLWAIGLIGIICSISLVIAWISAGRISTRRVSAKPMTLRELPRVFDDRLFLILCCSAIIMTLAAGTAYASFAFFVSYAMGREDALVQIGILSGLAGIVVMMGSPIWVWVARRLGKKNTYILAATGHGATVILWSLTPDAPIWVIYIYNMFLALFNSGWGLIILSLLSDVIASSRDQRGENRGGAYSAVWSIIEKAGIAAGGSLIVGSILSIYGFDADLARQGQPQSAEAIRGIVVAFGIVPGGAKILAALFIWKFLPGDAELAVTPVEPVIDEEPLPHV